MTLTMADSIYPENLPADYDAYLGYVDGEWPTAPELYTRFPGKPILSLTVLGGRAVADGCDRETGDLTAASAARWVAWRLAAGAWRPVIYASIENMAEIWMRLNERLIARDEVRLLSAHWNAGPHICGPATCKYPGLTRAMDGTQHTNKAAGIGGSKIDSSLLADDFFGAAPKPTPVTNWQEIMMSKLPVVREGARGADVRTVQGLCIARGHTIKVDGIFGPVTASAVRQIQATAKIAVDGIVGPQTWPVLMHV